MTDPTAPTCGAPDWEMVGRWLHLLPGAAGQSHEVIEGANHVIQEDASTRLVEIIHEFTKAGHR